MIQNLMRWLGFHVHEWGEKLISGFCRSVDIERFFSDLYRLGER